MISRLTRIAGALKIVQDLLVDVAEMLALGQVIKVDAVDLVDHLAHPLTATLGRERQPGAPAVAR